ncbi:PhzF family phenazine biosynthesis protein [Leptolyngbya sp. FACHB-541]|uniref:PhzF family phenazine biosynthesis protein n=1 Tax=Leptolyngbya sp. FACHB-541 TaxID=2692810 RepID=UPI0016861E28|nr:PhzF family phenazine biosynthesis protein [Leptolyngbya sp. FACHB-541]MBD1996462.1 PhzF family phenazine biosynthesis protein [Leptolyngbya sp. FACHB-541]
MRYRFYTADVFTDQIFGGNPLAVFPDARGLSTEQMQRVAKELNLSETVFVFPPQQPGSDRQLRIFTPARELPFAGHPTVGTAYVLATLGEITAPEDTTVVFEEGVGPVSVDIRVESGKPTFAALTAAKLPEFRSDLPSVEKLAAVLSLEPADLLNGEDKPQAISCGVPFLFVPLSDRAALSRIQLNRQEWQQCLASAWAPDLYVFAYDPQDPSHLWARMFAPTMNIDEDPATGAAATAIAGYLCNRNNLTDGTLRWSIEQGVEMSRPSLLQVEADLKNSEIQAIRVGGSSILVSEGTMEIPDSP